MEANKNRHNDYEFTVYDEDDEILPIDGSELTFMVKVAVDPDETATIEKQNTAAGGNDTEIEYSTDGIDGKFKLHLLPADLVDLTRNVWYSEIKMTLDGKDHTIFQDHFYIKPVLI